MKTKISLLLLAILCNISVFAQSDFDKYFEKKSLRVDFALSGNLKSQSISSITEVIILMSMTKLRIS